MTTFIRLLKDQDKRTGLLCGVKNSGEFVFDVDANSFRQIPGSPFAYWVSEELRRAFLKLQPVESEHRVVRLGASTKNDFRFLRLWWETESEKWTDFAKGGAFSRFYSDIHLKLNWIFGAREIEAELLMKFPYLGDSADFVLHRNNPYLSPGITWSRRSQKGLSLRALPAGCVFADNGPVISLENNDKIELLNILGIVNSCAFNTFVSLQISFGSYEVGVIQKTPVPATTTEQQTQLATLARRAWFLNRTLDTVNEASHAFLLPAALRDRLSEYDPAVIEIELARIQTEIDEIAFDLYRFSEVDRQAALGQNGTEETSDNEPEDEEESDAEPEVPQVDGLLSWAVGVAFGRFDWRLATGERAAPPEPDPFDSLPAKSPGMLPDGDKPFREHHGILVDDSGHSHDLARLVEEVLTRLDVTVPEDVRRWLQRDFFTFHLQRYSKSRRKAPIYWPLSTTSGSYTLWVYYPSLTSQTLYTAINDFVEPKLKQVGGDVTALRNKGSARSRDDERLFEALQAFELELIELRDTLLKLAPTYKPNHDDGVQISASPLWPLFRHKPWQKVLKDSWAKLEKGDYDWAHLAMNYWPERVREKCKTDKSLAIAHGLESLYIEPEAKPKKARGKKKQED